MANGTAVPALRWIASMARIRFGNIDSRQSRRVTPIESAFILGGLRGRSALVFGVRMGSLRPRFGTASGGEPKR